MSQDFTPIFEYLDSKFSEQDERFLNVESKINTLQNSVDAIMREVIITRQ